MADKPAKQKPLAEIFIPRRYIKPNGKVDLWDMTGPLDESGEPTGPVKLEFTGILAREALQRDPERYKVDLPRGVKPGPAQAEAEERAAADQTEADAEANRDPVYGGTTK
jgi:hypothetical protein